MSPTPLGQGRPSEPPCVDSAPSTLSLGQFKHASFRYNETVTSVLPEFWDRSSNDTEDTHELQAGD